MQPLNLIGQTFHNLTVVVRAKNNVHGNTCWICKCQCGATTDPLTAYQLKSGKTKSCGCLRRHGLPALAAGQVFARLTLVERVENDKQGNPQWKCRCVCGEITVVRSYQLYDKTQSCGCFRLERLRASTVTHGHASAGNLSREYKAWCEMKKRCSNPRSNRFKHYGGRGITVSPLWINDFQAFLNHIGPCPPGLELDRIEVNGHYEIGNVRWVNQFVQAGNTRRNVRVTHNGETMIVSDWARRYNIKPGRLRHFLVDRKMSLDAAITRIRELDSKNPS